MEGKIKREYQVCTSCVMDTTDSKITFDENGVCDHCNNFFNKILPNWKIDDEALRSLEATFNKIKKYGRNKKYDCIIGLSGGRDSSYVLLLAKKYGLRPVIYSVDCGWNDKVADENMRKLVEYTGFDFVREEVDRQQFMDFQRAFIKSQIASIDVQDVMIFSNLYKFSVKNKIKYILTGGNYSTESCREPVEWCGLGVDTKLIKDIRKKFGTRKWNKLCFVDIFKHKIFYKLFKGMKVVYPLNQIQYTKQGAIDELAQTVGWTPYKNKHFESVFTRFYEGYWLLEKFGFDKRRAHFSSLILSNQMTRQEALDILREPPYPVAEAMRDLDYICKKLDMSKEEFFNLMQKENKSISDYKSRAKLIKFGAWISKTFGKEKRNLR